MIDPPRFQSDPVVRKIRVGVCHCRDSVLQLVCRILESAQFQVVAGPRTSGVATSALDLLVCDLSSEAIRAARRIDRPTAFLMCGCPTFSQLLSLISLKCYALVELDRPGELILACESLLRGRKFVSSHNAIKMLQQAARPSPAIWLEPAEQQVLEALQQTANLDLIAARLNSSPEDVALQKQRLYSKLGVSTRKRALRRARALELLS